MADFSPDISAEPPGATSLPPEPSVPPIDPAFALIEQHRGAYDHWLAVANGRTLSDFPAQDAAESEARAALLAARPTTIAGLKAWTDYIEDVAEREGDYTIAVAALPTIAKAMRRLVHAPPVVGPGCDAALIADCEQFLRLIGEETEAYKERGRLQALHEDDLPEVPRGLLLDPEKPLGVDVDYLVWGCPSGEGHCYTAKAVERLRARPRTKDIVDYYLNDTDRVMKRIPDPEAQARAETVIAAFEEWDRACQARAEANGLAAAIRRHVDIQAQLEARFERIEDATPVSLRGLAAVADVGLRCGRYGDLSVEIRDRLREFAEAAASPAMLGTVPTSGTDDEILAGFEAWVAAIRKADAADEAGAAPDHVAALRATARALRMNFIGIRATTLRGLLLKAMGHNGAGKLWEMVEADQRSGLVTSDAIARSVLLDLIVMAGITPQDWPVGLLHAGDEPASQTGTRAVQLERGAQCV